jgi:hypothetical protein
MISSELVARLVGHNKQIDPSNRQALLQAAREGNEKCAAILLSAWEGEGQPLSEEETAELDAHRRRAARYQSLFDEISQISNCYAIKGAYIAGLYPRGIVRQFQDLDLVAPEEADFWKTVRHILRDGWEISIFTVWKVDGRPRPIAALEREEAEPPLPLPDAVHLSAIAFPGNTWGGVPPRAVAAHEGRDRSPAGDLLRVVAERLERPFASRDVLDAMVLAQAMTDRDAELFARLLDSYDLRREWDELAARANRLQPLPPVLAATPHTRTRMVQSRARRLRGRAATFLPPTKGAAAYAQLRMLEEGERRLDRFVIEHVLRRASAAWALKKGLPLFGLLETPASDDSPDHMILEPRGKVLSCRTPVGTFALGPSDELEAE